MSNGAIFALILLSLAGLGYLAGIDSKRRRIHGLSKVDDRPLLQLARNAAIAPGLYPLVIGHWSGLTNWAGAVVTLGWVMVSITRETYAKLMAFPCAKPAVGFARTQQGIEQDLSSPARTVPLRFKAWHVRLGKVNTSHSEPTKTANLKVLKALKTKLKARLQILENRRVIAPSP